LDTNHLYVLIIFMTPGGDFIGKQEIAMADSVTCQRGVADIKNRTEPMGVRLQGKCVQRDRKGMNVGSESLD
jgi:hypothetical protein